MSDFPDVMTIEQVAEYLQLHPQVVYRHVKAGTLPASRIGRTIRFKKSVLDAFLEKDGWSAVQMFFNYVKQQRAGSAATEAKINTSSIPASARAEMPVMAETADDVTQNDRSASHRFTADVD
jgi:excisionase family DNA binding protein